MVGKNKKEVAADGGKKQKGKMKETRTCVHRAVPSITREQYDFFYTEYNIVTCTSCNLDLKLFSARNFFLDLVAEKKK